MTLMYPDWNDPIDRKLYEVLFYHNEGRSLTTLEEEFCKKMYHFEEYSSGLDGR